MAKVRVQFVQLPESNGMCYKRMMQGIKRRRRKKGRPAGKTEPQQAPLQPVYPEDQEIHVSAPEAVVNEPAAAESQPEADAGAGAQGDPAQRARRKRRRGGAGRNRGKGKPGRPAQTGDEAVADVPASVEGDADDATAEGASAPVPRARVQPAQAQKKESRGTVVLTIGLPGSGKTSWFR